MSELTITQDGTVLTETKDGITMPANYRFACINDYVHGVERYFEELQWLALGMATHVEKIESQLATMTKQRDDLLVACKGAANYIDRLGGNSGAYRIAIANVKGE